MEPPSSSVLRLHDVTKEDTCGVCQPGQLSRYRDILPEIAEHPPGLQWTHQDLDLLLSPKYPVTNSGLANRQAVFGSE